MCSLNKKTRKIVVCNTSVILITHIQKIMDAQIYQIKITLKDSKPAIWRRVLVPATIALDILHDVIQCAMGWEDGHLHQFIKDRQFYSPPDPDGCLDVNDSRKTKLSDLMVKIKGKIEYEYDFGDSWRHEIVLEKILPFDENTKYPVCIEGKMNCPPEDCGGVWGYADLLQILKNPEDEQYEDMLDWLGGEFDPEEFDIEETNKYLANIKLTKTVRKTKAK